MESTISQPLFTLQHLNLKFPEPFERVGGGKSSNEFPQSGQFLLLFA
jgi:hypothetical protein